ncbi:hypothetical protein, partial [Streptococcus pyogenes]|uniref:hypothetical protein n=1 Tax=Streptococcus pyogenes TaxID=1314 RepID=UPI0035C0AAFC
DFDQGQLTKPLNLLVFLAIADKPFELFVQLSVPGHRLISIVSALALLFAIIRVKTIPFVILDEVEAALDEANVKRFGDFLNR